MGRALSCLFTYVVAPAAAFLLFATTQPRSALAGGRVVVEEFSGPDADRFRKAVQSALAKQGVEIVSDKKVASVSADLGLMAVSDAYAAVGRELRLSAFIGGKTEGGKKPKARLIVRDAGDGSVIGEEGWTGANPAKMFSSLERDLPSKLSALLARTSSGGAETATAPASPARKPTAAEEPPANEAASDETVGRRKKPAAKEAEVTEEAVASSPGGHMGYDVALGTHLYSRTFKYNQSIKGDQKEYKVAVAPAVSIAGDLFPLASLPFLGVTASFEYTMSLLSQDAAGSTYATKAFSYSVGAKGQYDVGPALLNGTVAFGNQVFEVVTDPADKTAPHIAGVGYQHIRAGAGGRVSLSDGWALLFNVDYLHVLQTGDIQVNYFAGAVAKGGDVAAGVAFPLPFLGLEGRAMLDFRRYVFDMMSIKSDDRWAGGATDQYIGLNLAVAYRSLP